MSKMPTQQELDNIWDNAKKGYYEKHSGAINPEILCDDEAEQVLTVPNKNGTYRNIYRRKPGEEWEIA